MTFSTIVSKSYIKLSPFLLFYILIVIFKQENVFVGDEGRYWDYAGKLICGFYADSSYAEYSFLWNGPGYPIFLMIFKYLNIPVIVPKLFNGVLLYLALLYFYKTLVFFLNKKHSFLITILLGLYYPNLMQSLPKLLTEALSFFLVCAMAYYVLKFEKDKKRKYLWLSSFLLGYLILTKVIFAYVTLAVLICFSLLLFYKKIRYKARSIALILLGGILFTTPYLYYTYNLTGKFFYYANSGGMSLYWMSTPYENEFGDWHYFETLSDTKAIEANHIDYLTTIANLSPVEKDSELKRKAIENIIHNKSKFFKNWRSNIGRIFFGYPYSYQKPSNSVLYYALPNSYILVFLSISLVLAIRRLKKLDATYGFFILFSLLYLTGISVLSAYPRFLYPILPLLLLWISYVFNHLFKNLKLIKTKRH